jgi:hypothetical protein
LYEFSSIWEVEDKMKAAFLCLACVALILTTADAKFSRSKKSKGTPTPVSTATPPGAPSVDVSKFVSTNIDKILAPLDQRNPMPRAELAQMRASFAQRFSKASLAERPQFQTALGVCDGLAQVMDERDKAMLNPTAAAAWPQRSVQLRQYIDQILAQERAAEGAPGAASPSPGR